MVDRKSFSSVRYSLESTPALAAAWYASSGNRSQPPNTMSSSLVRGTNSLISGDLPSVRLPRRMVPICVSEPMGLERPRRMASTPAMNVVATAPIPGSKMPSFPLAGRIPTTFPAVPEVFCDMGAPAISKTALGGPFKSPAKSAAGRSPPALARSCRARCNPGAGPGLAPRRPNPVNLRGRRCSMVVDIRPLSTPHVRGGVRACPDRRVPARVTTPDEASGGKQREEKNGSRDPDQQQPVRSVPCRRRSAAGGVRHAHHHPRDDGGGRSLRSPDQALEPEDEELHLRRASV